MFSETVLTPALPSIMEETSVSTNVAQWLTTGFILVSAIMIPLTAFFINRFPTKRLFISAMSLFAFGCLLCAISPNFSVILLGRFFQAAGAGIMMPLCQTVVLVLVPLSKRGTAMGVIGLVMALAPAIGPTLAGWVIDIMGWHIMFYIITALAVLDIVLAGFVLENVIESSNPKLDMPSVLLSSLGLASFTLVFYIYWYSDVYVFCLTAIYLKRALFGFAYSQISSVCNRYHHRYDCKCRTDFRRCNATHFYAKYSRFQRHAVRLGNATRRPLYGSYERGFWPHI